jgi:hypothetical protein
MKTLKVILWVLIVALQIILMRWEFASGWAWFLIWPLVLITWLILLNIKNLIVGQIYWSRAMRGIKEVQERHKSPPPPTE